MRILSLILLFSLISSCTHYSGKRAPSSTALDAPCSEGIQLFFEESTRRELGHFSEEALIDLSILRQGELDSIRDDVVFSKLILSEDEHLREETVKVIALIRRHRPDLPPAKVNDFYHELFQSCKL